VLLVDDNATHRRALSGQFSAWGMPSAEAAHGDAALEQLDRSGPFQLVVLDGQMPGRDGPALLEEMRRRGFQMPAILLTGVGDSEMRRRAQPHGLSAYLTKPVKQSLLLDAVMQAVGAVVRREIEAAGGSLLNKETAKERPLRILLAEDNTVNQKVALQVLKRLGYRADVAANGLEVLKAVELQTYDVILMDVLMPEMDGLEATRQLRKRFEGVSSPHIIAMTANAMQGDREECLAAGMDDYVGKPMKVEELVAALNRTPRSPAIQAPVPVVEDVTAMVLSQEPLDALRELTAGEPNTFIDLIHEFLQNSEHLVGNIRNSFETGDTKTLERAAHSLKSSAAMFGATDVSRLAARIEEGSGGAISTCSAEDIRALATAYSYARKALEELPGAT